MSDYKYDLTRQQIADHLGVSVKSITRYIQKYGFPFKKAVGKNNRLEYRFSSEEVDKWNFIRQRSTGTIIKKTSITQDTIKTQDTEIKEKRQNRTETNPPIENKIDKDGSAQVERVVSLLENQITSLGSMLDTLREQLANLNNQLEAKDVQIKELQNSHNNLLAIHQATSNRLEAPVAATPLDSLSKEPNKPVSLSDKAKAKIVKRVKKLSKEGYTPKQISKQFNGDGVSTFSGRGMYHARTIRKILED